MAKWKVPQKAKRDANEGEIVAALRKCGVTVQPIDQPVDLLCCYRGVTFLVEVKNPDGRNRETDKQREFFETWPGQFWVVRSIDEALAVLPNVGVSR